MPQLEDKNWLRDFAFLVDITGHLNSLNTQLQGRGQFVNVLFGHIKAFQYKLILWIKQLSNGNSTNFIKLTEQGLGNHGFYFAEQLRQMLEQSKERFIEFKDHELELDLFSTPLHFDPEKAATPALQMELIELQQYQDLKVKFLENDLVKTVKTVKTAKCSN